LSILLRDVKEESQRELRRRFEEKDKDRQLFPRIQRIILYIDDLDRCPEKTVFEVLQAVHLLLAFPLFVVVVGVDPRWLLHSLEQHSVALQAPNAADGAQTGEDSNWESTPLNYLEKIFQIPYTLLPISEAGFGSMVNRLAKSSDDGKSPAPGPNVTRVESVKTADQPSPAPLPNAEVASETAGRSPKATAYKTSSADMQPENEALTLQSETIDRNPSHLRIEEQERNFMKLLHAFIPSPRAGKRFVNIYRLLRASVEDKERADFVGDTTGGDYQAALLLLAILTGFPSQATELFRALVKEQPKDSWWTFVESFRARTVPDSGAADSMHADWIALYGYIDAVKANMKDRSCTIFADWAIRVARYSFQSGRVVLAQSRL
jgi:hypothetical protein